MPGPSPHEPPPHDVGGHVADEPDILARIDALVPPAAGGIVPSADIWDDDPDLDDGDEGWLRSAHTVMHDPDGEPYDEPLDDPLYDGRTDEAMASKMARWGHDSALGASMAGFGRAIQNILQARQPVEIHAEAHTDLDDDLDPVTLHLVPDRPRESVAVVRPWLLGAPRRRRRHRRTGAEPTPGVVAGPASEPAPESPNPPPGG